MSGLERPLSYDVAEHARAMQGELGPVAIKPRAQLLWLGVDLDGTLAESIWTPQNPTQEIGVPIWTNVRKLLRAVAAGYKPIVHSSRPWTDYERVETWMDYYEIPYKYIQLGKPLYAAYIDDRAIPASAPDWIPND